MKFRLGTMAYVFALLAAGMAAFGAVGGIFVAGSAAWFWAWAGSRRWAQVKAVGATCFAVLAAMGILCAGIVVARDEARRSACQGRLCQLALALNNHHSLNGSYPAASLRDSAGTPLHSWRTIAALQFGVSVGAQPIDLAQAWDSAANRAALGVECEFLRCPACLNGSPETDFFAVVDERTAWPHDRGWTIAEITDDPALTILLVESWRENVAWGEPVDLSFDEAVDLLSKSPLPRTGHEIDSGFFYLPSRCVNVALVNGRVTTLRRELAVALLTVDGGETIDEADLRASAEPVLDYGRIWALLAFVGLAVWPGVRVWRRA